VQRTSSDIRVPVTVNHPYQPTGRIHIRCSANLLGSELHKGFSHQRALSRWPVVPVCKYPVTFLRQNIYLCSQKAITCNYGGAFRKCQ